MPAYRRNGGSVTRAHLRVRVGGSTLGAGRRLRTPFVDPPPDPPPTGTGATVYSAEPLGAGGFVTGISISPDGLTRLTRTDTLGAWRWSSTADVWKPAITGTSMPADGSGNFSSGAGVQAIAAVNSIAFMGYRSSIYKSVDKGATWTVSLANGPATAPNNGEQRWYNARLVFDPNNAAVCLYGTYSAGVWFTTNSGSTWTQVASGSVPFGLAGWGIPCVEVDGSGNWYAAPYGNGVYRSANQGTSWTKISSDAQFTTVTGMKAGANGDLMVTGGTDTSGTATSSVVYRYRAGTWANLTPIGGRKWRTVAYDPNTPGQVHVQGDGGYHRRSTDYGTTWIEAFQSMASDGDVPWLAAANGYGADYFFTTLGGLQFDPVVPNRLWMSQGIGVWYVDLSTTLSTRVAWQAQSRGIEQLVVSDALAPPGGPTVALCWDRALFVVAETGAAPAVTIAPTIATPAHSPATLQATLTAGYPTADMTFAWSVQSKPGGSSGGSFSAPTALLSTFTPDVTGSYTLRLTATNSRGTSTTDVALTATTAVTVLSIPSGNYVSAPERANLDITGSLTLIIKVAMDNWQPTSSSNIPLIGKNWLLRLSNLGLSMQLPVAGGGSFGNASGVLPFAAGSVNWCRLAYNASTQRCTLSTSPDGTTWTVRTDVDISAQMQGKPLVVSTEALVIGHQGGSLQPYLAGKVYRGQVYDGSTLVADFNAEPVTRTGTRLPATVTDSTGLVWTPQGTGWDWA